MKQFLVENNFWNLFPDAKIGIITCYGIDNTIKDQDMYKNMISQQRYNILGGYTNEWVYL